jgi:hypothetical protein
MAFNRQPEGMQYTIKTKCPHPGHGKFAKWHAEVRIDGIRGVVHTTQPAYSRKSAIKLAMSYIVQQRGTVVTGTGTGD